MLNVAWILLLNESSSNYPGGDFPGAQVIAPGFTKLILPTALQQIRQELFGADPDYAMLAYRSWQLLQLIHSTELGKLVFALDPRATYLERTDRPWYGPELFTPQINQTSGNKSRLDVYGQPAAPDSMGRMFQQFTVSILSDSQLEVLQVTPPRSETIVDYTLSNGLSQPIPLGQTGFFFRTDGRANASWDVEFYIRPQLGLSEIAANLQSRSGSFSLDVFGPGPAEPYKTFQNLWESHQELPYKLGGLVTALIYRCEEIRTGKNL